MIGYSGEYAGVFNSDEIRMMTDALNDALKGAQANGATYAMGDNAEPARDALAKLVIQEARQGERDPRRISEAALHHLAATHK